MTQKIRDTLRAADLERREINDVPLGAMYRLTALGMIDPAWKQSRPDGNRYHRVKLTLKGLRMVQRIIRADTGPPSASGYRRSC